MSFLRSVLVMAFWFLAVLAMAPAVASLYPVVYDEAVALQGSGGANLGGALRAIADRAGGVVGWLIVSALCAVNATLLNILSALSRL